MIKKIPGNTDLLLNEKGQFFNNELRLVNVNVSKNGNVNIEMFGVRKIININILILLVIYEVYYIANLDKHIDKITFHKTNDFLRVTCKNIMTFKEPIYYKNGFRYIPSYVRYAINIDSVVIDTFTNKVVIDRDLCKQGYERIYIHSSDKNMNKHIRVHRLMALAFLPNNDFINKPIINHIDSNKSNNKLENLEWCSFSHNSNHALDFGENNTRIKMKSRDVFTGEVVIYKSGSEIAKVLGMTNTTPKNYVDRLPGYLYKGRYEIKYFDDNSDWYYNKVDEDFNYSKPIYVITVIDKKTGVSRKFHRTKDFQKMYKLYTTSGFGSIMHIDQLIIEFKSRYKDHDVSYIKNSITGPYYIINILNNKVAVLGSLTSIAEYTGRGRSEIQIDLTRGKKYIYDNKWIILVKTNKFDIKEYSNKAKPFNKVLIVNELTGEETIANSIKHAARLTNCQFKTMHDRLKTGQSYKGMKFRLLD